MAADLKGVNVWGGPVWRNFVAEAFAFIGQLQGKRVLEIGFRDGAISRYFAQHGGSVVGVEVDAASVARAIPSNGVTFRHYSGSLDEIEGTFDLVFTKSVLVLTRLEEVLPAIEGKLAPGGLAVFIENGRGSLLFQCLRFLAHPSREYSRFSYFTADHIAQIGQIFEIERLKYNSLPPVYLICARKKARQSTR